MAIIQFQTTEQGPTWINTDYIVAINAKEVNSCEIVVRGDSNYGITIANSAKEAQESINSLIRTIG